MCSVSMLKSIKICHTKNVLEGYVTKTKDVHKVQTLACYAPEVGLIEG